MSAREILLGNDPNRKILFLAVATGEGVANLPPILEVAKNGDQVLWLETETAKDRGWVTGPQDVITQRNAGIIQNLQTTNERPDKAAASLGHALMGYGEEFHAVLVENGGTKPLTGALAAWLAENRKGQHSVIYGQAPRVELWLQPNGASGPLTSARYERARLTSLEVLKSFGYEKLPDLKAKPLRRLWPLPDLLDDADQYGLDATETANAHRLKDLWAQIIQAREGDYATFAATAHLEKAKITTFSERVEQVRLELAANGRRVSEVELRWFFDMVQQLSSEVMAYAKLAPFDEVCSRSPGWVNELQRMFPQKSPQQIFDGMLNKSCSAAMGTLSDRSRIPNIGRLGDRFELAVARRVRNWAERKAARFPINEIWWGLRVAPIGRPAAVQGTPDGEFDITFVMANGVLFALECKSFLGEENEGLSIKKDFLARLFNLQTAGSRLARIAICGPIYTSFADEEEQWFWEMHRGRLDVDRLTQFKFIAFTLGKQPGCYSFQNVEYQTPSFEQTLETLLNEYLPE